MTAELRLKLYHMTFWTIVEIVPLSARELDDHDWEGCFESNGSAASELRWETWFPVNVNQEYPWKKMRKIVNVFWTWRDSFLTELRQGWKSLPSIRAENILNRFVCWHKQKTESCWAGSCLFHYWCMPIFYPLDQEWLFERELLWMGRYDCDVELR